MSPGNALSESIAEAIEREIERGEVDASDYERPTLPPVLREPETLHLAKFSRLAPRPFEPQFETWCRAVLVSSVVFDSRIATCPTCLERHKAAVFERIAETLGVQR